MKQVNVQFRGQEFEQIVWAILSLNSFDLQSDDTGSARYKGPDSGADLIGYFADHEWFIEAKYSRSSNIRIELLQTSSEQLISLLPESKRIVPLLVVSAIVPPEVRNGLNRRFGIYILDGIDLLTLASKEPDLLEKLQGILEWNWESWGEALRYGRSSEDILNALRDARPPITSNISIEKERKRLEQVRKFGVILCADLRKIPPGKTKWGKYEEHCEKIIKHLFGNDIGEPSRQVRTLDSLNRYDFICRVRSSNEFWRFLTDRCGSRYVVFECKNYKERIGQGEILTTEKYLLERAFRRVAIVLTRNGENKASYAMRGGAMREHGKLILVLTDEDICGMLEMRGRGEDPADHLSNLTDSFLMSLAR
jgi:hypothetical protein